MVTTKPMSVACSFPAGAWATPTRPRVLLPLAKEKGDPVRGKEVFTATCAVCHIFNGQGGKVGPDLTGIAARDRSEIFTSADLQVGAFGARLAAPSWSSALRFMESLLSPFRMHWEHEPELQKLLNDE